jgi:hypothetical protein
MIALGAVATSTPSTVSIALTIPRSGRYASGEWHRVHRTFSKKTTWLQLEQEKIFTGERAHKQSSHRR